jgi:hypothetical protein
VAGISAGGSVGADGSLIVGSMLAVGNWIVSAGGVDVLAHPVSRAITIRVILTRNMSTPFYF